MHASLYSLGVISQPYPSRALLPQHHTRYFSDYHLFRIAHSLINTQAYMLETFATQCSLPSNAVNFDSAPNVRGTLDILWTCLTILILCTWSIQHLSVPPQVFPRTKSQWFRRTLFLARRKAIWMLITLLAPEFTFGLALADLLSAGSNVKDLKGYADEDGVPWTYAHACFADTGGIVIYFPPDLNNAAEPTSEPMDSHGTNP